MAYAERADAKQDCFSSLRNFEHHLRVAFKPLPYRSQPYLRSGASWHAGCKNWEVCDLHSII